MKSRILVLPLALCLLLAMAGVSLGSGPVELSRWMLGAGASDAAGGGVTLRASLGQPVVGVGAGGTGRVSLHQGFWRGGSLPERLYHVYLPLIKR